jgi:hypothetical protein
MTCKDEEVNKISNNAWFVMAVIGVIFVISVGYVLWVWVKNRSLRYGKTKTEKIAKADGYSGSYEEPHYVDSDEKWDEISGRERSGVVRRGNLDVETGAVAFGSGRQRSNNSSQLITPEEAMRQDRDRRANLSRQQAALKADRARQAVLLEEQRKIAEMEAKVIRVKEEQLLMQSRKARYEAEARKGLVFDGTNWTKPSGNPFSRLWGKK